MKRVSKIIDKSKYKDIDDIIINELLTQLDDDVEIYEIQFNNHHKENKLEIIINGIEL